MNHHQRNVESIDYQFLVESLPGLYLVLSANAEILNVSQKYLDTVGKKRKEISGLSFFKLIENDGIYTPNPEVPKLLKSAFELAVKEKKQTHSSTYKFYFREPNAFEVNVKDVYWKFEFSPVLDIENNIKCVFAKIIDLTSPEQVIRRVAKFTDRTDPQLRLFDAALSNSPDFYFVFDLSAHILYANKSILNLWQKELEDVVGKSFFELGYPSELAEKHHSQVLKVIESKEAIKDEVTYTSAFGTGHYEYIFVPIVDEEGEVEGVAGTARDITERKKIEEEKEYLLLSIQSKNDKLKQLNEYMETFVHAVAHDLRSPVAGLKLTFQLIKQYPEDHRFFDAAVSYVNRIDSMLQGLIQIIEVQENKEIKTEPISVKAALEDVKLELEDKIEESGAVIKYEEKEGTDEINYFRPYLQSVLRNLLSNAIKYRHNRRELEIVVRVSKLDRYVLLEVQDNGMGIDLQQHGNEIFRPFARFATGKEGKGIGLHIIKSMVEKNGGKVEVVSKIGEGSTFKFYLKEYKGAELPKF